MGDDLHSKLRRANQQNSTCEKEKLKNSSKKKLQKIIETKMKTLMIGAIAKIEGFFGEKVWGFDLPESECSNEQLDMELIWEQLRDEILNLGNKQIRAAMSELDLYDVVWTGYKYNFVPRGN